MQFDLALAFSVLRRTPETLRGLLAGLDDEWAFATEGEGTFSPFDVIGHLIDGEQADWIPRSRLILARSSNVTFAPFDRFMHKLRAEQETIDSRVEEFTRLREENVVELVSWKLTDRELDLEGEHPTFGSVTLRQLLATWVVHDLNHIGQIVRVMAGQYRTEVGPWEAFLPIVQARRSSNS